MRVVRLWIILLLTTALSGALVAVAVAVRAWPTSLALTLLHVGVGSALAVGIIPFAYHHWRDRRRWRRIGIGGMGLVSALILLLLSGGLLITGRYRDGALWLHFGSGGVLLTAVAWHIYRWSHLKALQRAVLLFALLAGGFALLARVAPPSALPLSAVPVVAAAPAAFRLTRPLPDYAVAAFAPDGCADCHPAIVAQWQQSIHAVADTELIYTRVVADFREVYGVEASNWCAGCHSPLRAARGELGLQRVDVSQSDVDCIVCHSVTALHDEVGNHGFDLTVASPALFDTEAVTDTTQWLTTLQPAAHQARWGGAISASPEFCGSCHRQVLPAFLTDGAAPTVIQDTYTEWLNSPYNSTNPFTRRTCQDCHMPYVEGESGNAPVRSHLVAGTNVEVARILGAHDLYPAQEVLLRGAATVTITSAVCATDGLSFEVHVTNSGAGHHLPTGVTDLREVWLEVQATDAAGNVVWSAGVIGADGTLPDDAVRFGTVLGDAAGNPVLLHDIARVRGILTDTTLAPTETRTIPYHVALPSRAASLTLQTRLLYRVVPQSFVTEYISPLLRFRVIPMTEATVTIACES